jgi:hypothetical protein
MPRVGFESTISVSERAKTVHALGRAAAVIGEWIIHPVRIQRDRLPKLFKYTATGKKKPRTSVEYLNWLLYNNDRTDRQTTKLRDWLMKSIMFCSLLHDAVSF